MDAQTIAYAKRYRRLFALFLGLLAAGSPVITNGVAFIFSGEGNFWLDIIAPGLEAAVGLSLVFALFIMSDLPVKPVPYHEWNRRSALISIGLLMLVMAVLAGLWINRPWSEHPLPDSVRLPATLTAVVAAALWIGLLASVYEWVLATKLHPPHPPGETPASVAPGIPPHL